MSIIYLSKKTCQTDASSGNSDLGVLDPKAADDGIEDRDKEHSDQIDVVQFVCCWLGIFKQSIFYIFLLRLSTCVFNVNCSNDHEKYSNYSLKMNHDDIFSQ